MLRILQEVSSLPTAPFLEQRVIDYVRAFAAKRSLKLTRDPFGNLLVELPGRRRSPRWVFAAHMDHPGFAARRMIDGHTLEADFRGYVLTPYLKKGTPVLFFPDSREVPAKVIEAWRSPDAPAWSPRAGRVLLRVPGPVPPNTPGMFDQGPGRTNGPRFLSRALDDLAGVAAALAMLDKLASSPPPSPVAVLLTRAEEEGFIGAIAASLHPKLLRKTDRIIAIECSAMQTYAPQGAGAIIRVGDRTSIFNSAITWFITHQAERLAARDRSFRFQRALMPGGTCEATVYDIYGLAAGSICVPLGNYHNMDTARHRIAPEFIDLSDWRNMVKLFLQIARHAHEYRPGHTPLKKRVEARFRQLRHLL